MSENEGTGSAAFNWRLEPVRRPNGGGLIVVGMTFIIVGILAATVGILVPEISSPGSDGYGGLLPATPAVYNLWKWPLFWGGSGLSSLGFSLWAIGQVIRAIFFLPGRIVRHGEVVGSNVDREETERLIESNVTNPAG